MDKLLKLPLKWEKKGTTETSSKSVLWGQFHMSKSFWFQESSQDFFSEPISVPE